MQGLERHKAESSSNQTDFLRDLRDTIMNEVSGLQGYAHTASVTTMRV